jgi:phage anti-repressor protein
LEVEKLNELIELKERFEGIAQSTEKFPVDFNEAWQWVGYSTKGNALRKLQNDFEPGIDFCLSEMISKKQGSGGYNEISYFLTTDCFKSFCMMAGTPKGKEVRKYYLKIEEAWNTPEAVMARARQMGAIPQWKDPPTARLREFRMAYDKGVITVNEYRLKGFNLPPLEGPATPPPAARAVTGEVKITSEGLLKFLDEYLELTENLDDYIKVNDLYAFYVKHTENPVSRCTFVRTMKGSFSVPYRQKKISGYPVLVFMGCKFKQAE